MPHTTVNDHLDPMHRALLHKVAHEMGIVPLERTDIDITRILKDLPEEDARALKRKFRKVWRSIYKQQLAKTNAAKYRSEREKERALKTLASIWGVGEKNPSKAQRRERKTLVHDVLNAQVAQLKKLIEPA